MAETGPHYFEFSTKFDGNGHRRCGACRRTYDDGAHIEITTLKPYTNYVCPSGAGLGHGYVWTGAYRPSLRTLRDHLCICGKEYVEEDREQWQLSWEMQTPFGGGDWNPVRVVRSRHAAHEQRDGLLHLIASGEPVRNVVLTQVAS